ncbi:MAG: tRNA lysidine(34) synthetase TilS [Sphingomonadales bacterium]|nr:tRNA lysidine(34) synthetase TilS [Sphingomonadales bacterium]
MDAALLKRFRADLAGLIGPESQRIGIALSGGPDSLALLLLAHRTLGDAVAAATVDHRLRPESADEAKHVAAISAELGVPHAILSPPEPITGNLQAGARAARYALLEEWRESEGLDWVATAHHADDQLETMVMRLLRGSGVEGLAAVRAINRRVIRPLLGFRKRALEAIVADSPFTAIDDPSNREERFDRVRLRRILEDLPDLDPAGLARSATALSEAAAALEWATVRAARRAVRDEGDCLCLDPAGLPAEIRRRLVRDCLGRVAPGTAPSGPALEKAIAGLEAGEKRSLGGVVCEGGSEWRFSPAPPRRTG